MVVDKKTLSDILAAGIKGTRQGAFVPEQVLKFFLEQCTGFCLTDKYLTTDPLAQWLRNEYDFGADEIADLIKEMREKARAETGVEILMPGQPVPADAIPPPQKEEIASQADEESGTEWNGELQEDDEWQAEFKEDEDEEKLSLVDEDAVGGMIVEEEEPKDEKDMLEMAEDEPPAEAKAPESPLVSSIIEKAESGAKDDWIPPPIVPAESVRHRSTNGNGHAEAKPAPAEVFKPEAPPNHAADGVQPPTPPAKPKRKQVSPSILSMNDAFAILTSLVTSGPEVEVVIANIAREKVLVGPDEAGAFLPTASPTAQTRAIREALCRQLVIEVDYAQYTGLRKVGGVILSEATIQSKELIEKAGPSLKKLEAAGSVAASESRLDDEKKIIDISGRLKASINSLNEVVSALSYIPQPAATTGPTKYEDNVHMKKKESIAAHQEKTHKTQKGPQGKSATDMLKIAAAAVFLIGVLVGTGYYVIHLFSNKTVIVNFNPKDYSTIMDLKEVRRDGQSMVGIIDDVYWSGMTKEERTERVKKLYDTVKSDKVLNMRLLSTKNKLLAQSYGDELKVF